MRLPVLVLAAFASACVSAPEPEPRRTQPLAGRDANSTLLLGHNRERAAVGAPPLAWDIGLAAAAAGHARQLAASGILRHSPRRDRPGQGENLWMGTRGAFTAAQMLESWVGEKRVFRPGIFPNVSSTGHWADAGHYSQMIWPTTTRLGCAIATGPRVDALVCRYSPAGNIDGRRVP